MQEGNRLNKVNVDILDFNKKEFKKKFTTKNNGTWVYCRQNSHLYQDLKKIMQQHPVRFETADGGAESDAVGFHGEELFDFW